MVSKLPILSRKLIAQDTWEICFGLNGKNFNFKPGQYIMITLPEVDLNNPKGNTREFSIISTTDNVKSFKIAFRQSDSDFKQALLAHSVGDYIKVSGPFGIFLLPKKYSSIVMIAAGLGVTPFISMINNLLTQNNQIPILLIYVNSKIETTAYLSDLKTLSNKNTYFDFIYSQNRLIKKNLSTYLDLNSEKTFLIAGPPNMVRETRVNLLDLGIKENQLILEEFTGY